MRGARKLAEQQAAALIIARRNELLGDQIHAIVQARNKADVARLVKFMYRFGIDVFDAKHNRLP